MAETWRLAPSICTHKIAKQHNPNVPDFGKGHNTLQAVYQRYVGEMFAGAHTADADMRATMAVYWAMKDAGHA
jgi:DNA polymerase III epsilon subunit-like protein